MAIDDAEILNHYGLDNFESPAFGDSVVPHGDGTGRAQGGDGQDELGMEGLNEGSHSHHSRLQAGDASTEDYDDDDDDDDDDYDDEGAGMLGDGGSVAATSHSVAISDRDPLHVHASVTQVLERKSDARALGDLQYRAKFSVSHKGFSPGAFMQVVHSDTSYADLVQGARLLRESMSQGSEALKILVHNNFDRFVDARNKIDLLYEEMKSRSLNSAQEYGTRAFGQALQDTTQKADEIYNPIIDRRARAEKIRATLSVVERYKFYFNLPFSLIEYTRKGKFDIAVREYKKGRQLLQAVTSGNIGSSAAEGAIAEGGESGATGLSRIFQHVWKEVQESVVELRNALFRHLSQAWRAYGEQETVIRHLLEIDPGDTDPVAFFLEHQHKWIVGQMHDVVQSFRQRGGQDWRQSSVEVETAAEQRADELTRALRIESFADFPALGHGRDAEFHAWKHMYNTLRALSQTLVRSLPDFWKLSQAYMEDMYRRPEELRGPSRRRRQGQNLDRVTKCHALLEDLINKYGQHVLRLTGVLGDSDEAVDVASLRPGSIGSTVRRLPQTHALLAGHFMTAIMELVVNTANDIEAIDMAAEAAIILANLISQLKAGLELFLCELWDRDAQAMGQHETWQLHHGTAYWPTFYIARRERTERGASAAELAETIANTELLPLFLRTAQTIIRQLGTLHAAALQPRKGGRAPQQQFDAGFDEGQRAQGERAREMNDLAVAHVKHTFFGTLYGFLDTLHMLAFKTQPVAEAGMLASLPYSVSSALSPQGAAAEGRRQSFRLAAKQSTEPSKARHSTRSFFLLASLCNLTAFRAYVIPDLLHAHAIRHVFKLEVGGSLQQLGKPFQRLDELVFGFYVGGRSAQLAQIVRRGVLLGGVSWATHAMPRDTQAYVAEALLFLVFTHAEVMDMIGEVGLGAEHHTVKHQPIARRVLEKLAADLLQEMLESVRRVDVFSEGGMLQSVLEAVFVRRTLADYMTPRALESFRLLHAYVRAVYSRAQAKARKQAAQQGLPVPEAGDDRLVERDGVTLSPEHWETVDHILRDCTRRTQIQFRCFQPAQ